MTNPRRFRFPIASERSPIEGGQRSGAGRDVENDLRFTLSSSIVMAFQASVNGPAGRRGQITRFEGQSSPGSPSPPPNMAHPPVRLQIFVPSADEIAIAEGASGSVSVHNPIDFRREACGQKTRSSIACSKGGAYASTAQAPSPTAPAACRSRLREEHRAADTDVEVAGFVDGTGADVVSIGYSSPIDSSPSAQS